MKITFRNASLQDIETIHSLAVKIWNEHYPSIISQQQIDYMLDLMYSPAALEKQMREENCLFTLVYADQVPSGYASMSEDKPGEYFIHKFYIDTTQHRKGIGTSLFNKMIDDIKDYKSIRLFVNRENFKPINFYFKQGFKIESVIDKHIGNNFFMNDFVMVKFNSSTKQT